MKIKLLFSIALAICIEGAAQISFENTTISDNSNYGSSISRPVSADLDGDNDLDLIAYYYEGNLVWFENKPNEAGLVSPKIIHNSQNGSNSNVLAVDIDNDGDMDIVASNNYDIFWYENLDGLGNFGNQIIITTNVDFVNSLDYYDIDGDGDFDILSTSISDNKVAWYENVDGSGTFGSQQIISQISTLSTNAVFAEDMDGDGDGDIVVNFSNNLVWIENSDGNGTFTTSHQISPDNLYSVFPVDLDNDGDIDIAVAEGFSDNLVWYKNIDGLGNFSNEIIIDSSINGDVSHVFADDIDGDGDIDILIDGIGVYYYVNDGNENFSGGQNIYNNSSTSSFNAIYGSDFDDDGDIDVISDGNVNNLQAMIYSEFDSVINEFKPERVLCEYISNPKGNFPADLDNDGDMDILVASYGDNKISWFEDVDGTQNFSMQNIISTTVYNPVFVTALDIDNDGDLDVFVGSDVDDKIVWFNNAGNGTFGNELIITTDTNAPSMIDFVDMDSDGDLDMLSASYNDDKIAWYENQDGMGSFGPQQIITTDANGPTSIYAKDIDNDGFVDLVATAYNDSDLVWYKSIDGQGNFGTKQIIDSSTYAKSLDINDVDNDGDLDILTPSAGSSSNFSWYENLDGNGQFSSGNTISFYIGSSNVKLVDIDADGDLDAVARTNNKISWYDNEDGLGTFGPGSAGLLVMSTSTGTYFTTADIDFDGDMDIIVTAGSNDLLAFSKNLGVLGNEINGTIKVDNNNDGCDSTDPYYPNIMVVANDGSNSFGTFTLNNGTYQIPVNSGNFTTSIAGAFPDYYTSNPIDYNFNYSNLGNTDTADFCLVANQSINDVNITIYPLSEARPGFDASYRIVYKNVGTEVLNGDINFQFDNTKLTFLTSSEPITTQTISSLEFNYLALNAFETRSIDLNFNVLPPPITNIDDFLVFNATINPISGDNSTEDNDFTFQQVIIGSFDPNDITCLEGDTVLMENADKYLHYIIRFQNTGTADAINVKVENTLDNKLDWNTLQIETASHSNRVEIVDGNELSFIFSSINLPDSTTDEPNSHGYVTYKIKPRNSVVLGDIINNTAEIYFDFNEAIITNTASTEFVNNALSIQEFDALLFSLYPNPTKGILNINSKSEISQVEILNNIGQQILIVKDKKSIDISSLNDGIYFVRINDTIGNLEVKKIIKN